MNIYSTCYELINTYIYGGTVVTGSYNELVCIAVSTLACLFVFGIPFILCWKILKML